MPPRSRGGKPLQGLSIVDRRPQDATKGPHAEQKAEQDTVKEDAFQQRQFETQGRLDKLSSARADRQRKVERELHNEFQLKSNLESLKWEMSIKNSNPDTVRERLGGIRAPIPSMQ